MVRWVGQEEQQVKTLSLGKETGREEGALRRPVGMTFFPPPGFGAPHHTRGRPTEGWWCVSLGRPWYLALLGEPHQRSHLPRASFLFYKMIATVPSPRNPIYPWAGRRRVRVSGRGEGLLTSPPAQVWRRPVRREPPPARVRGRPQEAALH